MGLGESELHLDLENIKADLSWPIGVQGIPLAWAEGSELIPRCYGLGCECRMSCGKEVKSNLVKDLMRRRP